MQSPVIDVLGVFLPRRLELSWAHCLGILSAGFVCKVLWGQYGILRHDKLPSSDLGWPIIGKTLAVFRMSLEDFGRTVMQGRAVRITNFFFSNVALVSYPVYQRYLHRLELDGELTPAWLTSTATVLGLRSVLVLPGGRGHALHKRLRGKILSSLAPRPTLATLPRLLQLVRAALDALAEETARHGSTTFEETAASLASKASTMMITAGLSPELQAAVEEQLDEVFSGLVSLPLDLGRFTAHGRAMIARRKLTGILRELMDCPNLERQNIIRDLAKASEEGAGFSVDEMVDTVFTLLVAGRLTTSEAMPEIFVRLSAGRDWAARVAREPLEFHSVEEDSATLRVVRESLRVRPPAGAYRRVCRDAIDLGEHGRIPPGTPMAVLIGNALKDMGADFDPDRWTPEASRSDFLAFGGPQPHACIGRHLALLELQVFARVLCREYDFVAIEPELVPNPKSPIAKVYKDGLRITITKKKSAS